MDSIVSFGDYPYSIGGVKKVRVQERKYLVELVSFDFFEVL